MTFALGSMPIVPVQAGGLFFSLFEPVRGSAPDIAGRGIANAIGQIWCCAMMREHLGHADAGAVVLAAIEEAVARG